MSKYKTQIQILKLMSRKTYIVFIGFFLAFIVSGFLLKTVKKPVSTIQKPLTFTRQFIGSNQYTGEIKGVMKTSFGKEKEGGRVTVSRGEGSLEFGLPINNLKLDSEDIGFFESTDVSFKSQDNIIEAKYSLVPNGLKEEIILNKIPQENRLPISLKTKNLKLKITPDGIPVFYAPSSVIARSEATKQSQDQYVFHFERPFMKDGSGNISYGVKYLFGNEKKIYGEQKKILLSSNQSLVTSHQSLILEIDSNWLHDPKRVLPITIDPTVVHDTTAEFATGQFNRVKDTGSGSSPVLETYYQELASDQYTVGLWHMNEGSDNTCSGGQDACDRSGNGYHGTFQADAAFTSTSKVGPYATTYDGTGDYTQVSEAGGKFDFTGTHTIEAWVRTTGGTTGYRGIVAKRDPTNGNNTNWEMDVNTSNKPYYCVHYDGSGNQTCALATTTLDTTSWYHVAGVYDRANVLIYINGKLEDRAFQTSALYTNDIDVYIGGNANVGYFTGQIDEVRISNIASTPEEIKLARSEERRVGKECRSRWSPYH